MNIFRITILITGAVIIAFSGCNNQGAVTEKYTKDTTNLHGNGEPARIKFYDGEIKPENLMRIETYYIDGKKHYTKLFDHGKETGTWYSWYKDGITWSSAEYENGKRHGKSVIYYQSGTPKVISVYKEGLKEGAEYYLSAVGDTLKIVHYEKGKKADIEDFEKERTSNP